MWLVYKQINEGTTSIPFRWSQSLPKENSKVIQEADATVLGPGDMQKKVRNRRYEGKTT